MSPVKVKTTFGNDRWPNLALQVVYSQVRFLACTDFIYLDHPMIQELSKLVTTNIIQRGDGDYSDEFAICVLGEVVRFSGNPRNIYTTVTSGKDTGGECMDFPIISSVTVRPRMGRIKRTMKSVISASGCCDRIQ